MTYRVLIAEDEKLTRDRLAQLIAKRANFELVAAVNNGNKAVASIKTNKPDIIFLDIKMPLLNGFEVLDRITQDDYSILVFITAYDEYALQAFEKEALDYLLKPFNEQRFDRLMSRVEKQLRHLSDRRECTITFKKGNHLFRIPTKEIILAESDNNHVVVYLKDRKFRKRVTLSNLHKALDPHFVKVHRSYVINEREIQSMKHITNGDYLFKMSNGKSIISSRSYRQIVSGIIKLN